MKKNIEDKEMPFDTNDIFPQVGTVLTRNLIHEPTQRYYLYVPRGGGAVKSVFVTVHGVKRMAKDHALKFASFAERYGVVLVAPLFPKDRFGDYQRLGRNGRGERADQALNRILTEVGFLTGANIDKLYMFGYSGGGQFVHRYAMAYPQRTARIVVAAAGWYTFPDSAVNYPKGIKRVKGLKDIRFDPTQFLSVPACVVVGEKDIQRDLELKKSNKIDQQQGTNRVERGRAWVEAMSTAAKTYHLDTSYDFKVLSGCRHSFTKCMKRGKMGKRVFRFLFGLARDSKKSPLSRKSRKSTLPTSDQHEWEGEVQSTMNSLMEHPLFEMQESQLRE
jgi:poly(3-hydroxybutyrate) depolymerase